MSLQSGIANTNTESLINLGMNLHIVGTETRWAVVGHVYYLCGDQQASEYIVLILWLCLVGPYRKIALNKNANTIKKRSNVIILPLLLRLQVRLK